MTTMENQATTPFNRFAIPVRWGIIISIVSIFITTIYGMFIMQSMGMMGMGIFGVLTFITMMLLLTAMAFQQRKAMGGYITFKEAFQAIFVSILIVTAVSAIYTFIYTNYIDTEYFEKTREMSIKMATSFGGEDARELAEAEADKQIEKQKGISGVFMGLLTSIILYSLFGFIIAAIVKRKKPEHLA